MVRHWLRGFVMFALLRQVGFGYFKDQCSEAAHSIIDLVQSLVEVPLEMIKFKTSKKYDVAILAHAVKVSLKIISRAICS